MRRRLAFASIVVILLSAVPAAAKTYHADRFDVRAVLGADRSLSVDEAVTFRMAGGTFPTVWRELPLARTDGIVDVVAGMDGVQLRQAAAATWAEVRRGRRSLRVTWHFPATNGVHEFTLRYRMLGVATAGESSDDLAWLALPREHDYAIDQASVTLSWPAGARLAAEPVVRPRNAAVTMSGEGLSIAAGRVKKDATIRVEARLGAGALQPTPPAWQARERDRDTRGPWLILIAAVVLAAGFGWLAAYWTAWSTDAHGPVAASLAGGPPTPDRPAAVAARLAGRGSRLQQVAATILELASRGVLRIEERQPVAKFLGRGFDVQLVAEPASPEPHEAATLEMIFGPPAHRTRHVTWRRVQQRAGTKATGFGAALFGTMRLAGLVDADRVAARRVLARAAVVTGLVAVTTLGVAAAVWPLFGAWCLVVPAATAAVAIALSIGAGRFPVLSRRGAEEARQWRAFLAGLASVARDKDQRTMRPVAPEWLPWAVAAGVGHLAARRLSGPMPAWFRPLATGEDGVASFEAFLTTIGSAGHGESSAGAAGSGGAAGGGSSGAS
jgi:hypothetical protein